MLARLMGPPRREVEPSVWHCLPIECGNQPRPQPGGRRATGQGRSRDNEPLVTTGAGRRVPRPDVASPQVFGLPTRAAPQPVLSSVAHPRSASWYSSRRAAGTPTIINLFAEFGDNDCSRNDGSQRVVQCPISAKRQIRKAFITGILHLDGDPIRTTSATRLSLRTCSRNERCGRRSVNLWEPTHPARPNKKGFLQSERNS